MLASASGDWTIKLWDVATGKEQATLKGHTCPVSVRGVQSGRQDAGLGKLGQDDQAVGRGDGQGTRPPSRGHTKLVYSVVFSPDGKTLASGSWDKTIKLWDVATGKERATLKGHTCLRELRWRSARTARRWPRRSADQTIKLWDVGAGMEQGTLKGHTERVCSVVFSPDGKTLASGSLDKTIKVWDIRSTQDRTARVSPDKAINRTLPQTRIEKPEANPEPLAKAALNDAMFFFNRAKTWVEKGDLGRAITDYDEAIGLDPQVAAFYQDRGDLWLFNANFDMAIKDYDEAIRLNTPKPQAAYFARGAAWHYKKNYEKAIEDFDKAIQANVHDALAWSLRGSAHLEKGDYDKAIEDFDEAIRLNPKDLSARKGRERALAHMGK